MNRAINRVLNNWDEAFCSDFSLFRSRLCLISPLVKC